MSGSAVPFGALASFAVVVSGGAGCLSFDTSKMTVDTNLSAQSNIVRLTAIHVDSRRAPFKLRPST